MPSSSDDDKSQNKIFPRFLVIEAADSTKPIPSHPIAVSKSISIYVTKPKDVKKMRSGALLVEVESHKQAQNLMKMDKIIDTPVKVSPHRSLNQCRGIIKSAELDHVSEDELLSEIRNQHATNVKKIYVTRDGMKKPTNT